MSICRTSVSIAGFILLIGCNGATSSPPVATGGSHASGGSTSSGGATTNGGAVSSGGSGSGGAAAGGAAAGGAASGGSGAGGVSGNGGTSGKDAGTSDATGSGGSSGTGGTVGSGGNASLGGVTGTGGVASSGGVAGTGGVSATGGTTTTFWTTTYNANCTPPQTGGRDQSAGHHNAGKDCMTSGCHLNPKAAHHNAGKDCTQCHAGGSPDGSGAIAFLFGGTVYKAGTTTGLAKVEVGVGSGSTVVTACSAANGNFWAVAGGSTVTWSSATAHARNAAGDSAMASPPAAGCNASACHSASMRLTAN